MTKYFSKEQWKSLPLEKRLQWWKATNYGQKEPPAEIVALFTEYLIHKQKRHRAAGDGNGVSTDV